MKTKNILIIAALLILGYIAYSVFAEGHRESLGTLTYTGHDSTKTYCVYQVESASPEADRSYANGDKVCIECCKNWPNVEVGGAKQCYARVTFTTGGQVTYKMKSFTKGAKSCYACTKGKGHYKCPD